MESFMRTGKYLLHLLVLSHAGWSSSDYFQLISGFFIIYKCCSHHPFSSLVLLGYFPMELCIPHLCSIVESSKPLFGSDTSSKGEVIPKLFSSQKISGYIIFQRDKQVCFLLSFPLSGKNLQSLFCVKEAIGFYSC